LAKLSADESKKVMKHLSDFERENLIRVLGKMPLIDFSHRCEVIDDENTNVVTAGAIVTVTVTLTRNNMSKLFGDSTAKVKDEIREEVEPTTNENGEIVEEPHIKEKKSMWKSMKPKRGGPGAKNKQKGGPKKVQTQQVVVKQADAVVKEAKPIEKAKESESEAESNEESDNEEKEEMSTDDEKKRTGGMGENPTKIEQKRKIRRKIKVIA